MKNNTLTNWISLLAILFVSLMPLVSSAFQENQPSDYQVICSENGLKIIPGNKNNDNDDSINHHLSHCSFCFFNLDNEVAISNAYPIKKLQKIQDISYTTSNLLTKKNNFLSGNSSQAPPSI